tara:strand:- start:879 stop:1043 length:165 start_codon:yes stop_codon:yes gene_type:complete
MVDIIYTKEERVACTGESDDHPKVYYTVPSEGYVVCGYCDLKYAKESEKEDDAV